MGEDAEVARNQITAFAEQLVEGGEKRAGQLDASKPVIDAGDARSAAPRLALHPPLEASGVVAEKTRIDALGENDKTRAIRPSARLDGVVDCERRLAPIKGAESPLRRWAGVRHPPKLERPRSRGEVRSGDNSERARE